MNKNHPPQISDATLERLIRTTLHSTILTDEEIDDVAESPRLWWELQSRIANEKSRRAKPWFFDWRWQTATIGAFVILIVAGTAIRFSNAPPPETVAVLKENNVAILEEKFVSSETKTETVIPTSNQPQTKTFPAARHNATLSKTDGNSSKLKSLRAETAARKTYKPPTARSPKAENATQFIALSYLPASESGQVVRVKVPRSMMVSLGVSTNVERGKELINAEVIVGDDGAARAIRFLNE